MLVFAGLSRRRIQARTVTPPPTLRKGDRVVIVAHAPSLRGNGALGLIPRGGRLQREGREVACRARHETNPDQNDGQKACSRCTKEAGDDAV